MAAINEPKGLEITTIDSYFSKIYSVKELAEFYTLLNTKLTSYKFPMEICLSSIYQDGTLLGTLTFQQLDINNYPTYLGDVAKSVEGSFGTNYSTLLNFVVNQWVFTLRRTDLEVIPDITINSLRTTSLDPTKVDYNEISRPTSGACAKPGPKI